MTGNRRVGLLVVPANNTTMEREMNALCPDFAPFLVARVKRPARTLTRDDLPAYRVSTLEAVEPFLEDAPELVVHGCTAAGFLAGRAGNAAMVEALRDKTGLSPRHGSAWPDHRERHGDGEQRPPPNAP